MKKAKCGCDIFFVKEFNCHDNGCKIGSKNTIMTKGDKIIWDSGFGYEIGYFIEEGENMYNSYKVNLISGYCVGESLRSKDEIKPYSIEIMNKYPNIQHKEF